VEYDFKFDALNRPIARFSMDHEAFGHWFTDELKKDPAKIESLLKVIERLENHEIFEQEIIGIDLKLTLNRDDVEANELHDYIDDEIPEETDFSDDHTHALCGLPDFKEAILSWQSFVLKNK
jgi:uncharacterized protein YacL (UPF0231 family)